MGTAVKERLDQIGDDLCDARDEGKIVDVPYVFPEHEDLGPGDDKVIEVKIEHCPKCGTKLLYAGGIGWFCPSKPDVCDVSDGIYPALSGCMECYPGNPKLDPRTRYDGWRLICPHSIFRREL